METIKLGKATLYVNIHGYVIGYEVDHSDRPIPFERVVDVQRPYHIRRMATANQPTAASSGGCQGCQ